MNKSVAFSEPGSVRRSQSCLADVHYDERGDASPSTTQRAKVADPSIRKHGHSWTCCKCWKAGYGAQDVVCRTWRDKWLPRARPRCRRCGHCRCTECEPWIKAPACTGHIETARYEDTSVAGVRPSRWRRVWEWTTACLFRPALLWRRRHGYDQPISLMRRQMRTPTALLGQHLEALGGEDAQRAAATRLCAQPLPAVTGGDVPTDELTWERACHPTPPSRIGSYKSLEVEESLSF